MHAAPSRSLRNCLLLLGAACAPLAQGGDAEPPKALSFPTSYTGEGFSNLAGGYKRGAVYEGLLSSGVQGDLEKLAHWNGATFLVSGLYPHGTSLTDNYVHDFNRASNIDAYDSVRLYEAWVQQELADGKISLRLGQILADAEFFASDSGTLFLNSAFGAIPVIGQNLNAPIYPTAAPGARVRWTASDALSVQAGLFDGAGDPARDNKHGVRWHLDGNDGVLAITEATYKLHGAKEGTGLPGVYKLGAFFHNSQSKDVFPEGPRRGDVGAYFIADQQLWRKPGTEEQGLSAYVRMGTAPDGRNTVPFCFDGGLNFKGLLPGREKDIAGFGFAYTSLSGNVRDAAGHPPGTHHEAILEATYKVAVKGGITVQPDFQYIFNPGGFQSAPNALVAGLRCTLAFP